MANDKKIIWKKAKKTNTPKNISDVKNILSSDEVSDLAQRSADYFSEKAIKENTEKTEETISDLKSEIEELFSNKQGNKKTLSAETFLKGEEGDSLKIENKKESTKGSASTLAAIEVIQNNKEKESLKQIENISEKNVVTENKEAVLDDIKKSIQEDLRDPLLQNHTEKKDDVQIAKLLEKKEKAKGVEKTYYSDLSSAMGSNNPKTMSELLAKSREEKKIKSITSPFSKRNILYIFGAILLSALIGGIIFYLWNHKKEKEVEFITEKRVSSLVYADMDTGINATVAEPVKTKQAIRKVIEEDLPDEDLKQIYYVGKDSMGNLRRLGIKQVFEATDNVPSELLYENIENDFMHGVYRTDKNEPFILLKALSYDRALKGMKEWEPTMIDDLSSYLDLPKEAGDRSLLEPGFTDDLINNKNVRVSRFLPREVDRRNGIFDLFKSKKTSSYSEESSTQEKTVEQNNETENIVSLIGSGVRSFILKSAHISFAQNREITETGISVDPIVDPVSIETDKDKPVVDNSIIKFENKDGIYKTIGGDSFVEGNDYSGLDSQKKVCFDGTTGERKNTSDESPADICYPTRQCWAYVCQKNGRVISTSLQDNLKNEGTEGVQCGKLADPIPDNNLDTYIGQKVCSYYTELINLKNLQSKNVCFDQDGHYVEGFARDENGNLPVGVNCIMPINRDRTVCVTESNQVVYKSENPTQSYKFCFEPLGDTTSLVDEQFQQNYGTLQKKAAVIALKLKALSLVLDLFNVDDVSDTLDDASDFFFQVSFGNIQENEISKTAIGIISRLERILSEIDPEGTLSYSNGRVTQIGQFRELIEMIKQSFGYSHNVAWVTLGNDFPDGFSLPDGLIYAGEESPVIKPIQQTLVEIGLMDPLSVTGKFDLVTQDAISIFQKLNGIPQSGVIDTSTIEVLNNIIANKGSFYLNKEIASIDNYLGTEDSTSFGSLGLGAYGADVQSLQIFLYAEGYEIESIDGVFDSSVCSAIQSFQKDKKLEQANENTCFVSSETINMINDLMKDKSYLGSGFKIDSNGVITGSGVLNGIFGPGSAVDFSTKEAQADTLKEGDVVLLYTFLDEETILITRSETIMDEIIKRRAFSDIFNK